MGLTLGIHGLIYHLNNLKEKKKSYIFINAETVFDKTFICDHTLRKLKTELSKIDKECK